jgi:hypothetical protein
VRDSDRRLSSERYRSLFNEWEIVIIV